MHIFMKTSGIVTIKHCLRCGDPYPTDNGMSKYCFDCRPIVLDEQRRASQQRAKERKRNAK